VDVRFLLEMEAFQGCAACVSGALQKLKQ